MAEETIQRVLKQYYGHTAFRPGAGGTHPGHPGRAGCSGGDAHRRGKSFVLSDPPPCCCRGLTVVVSPLISLMQDQVAALEEAGIPAAFLNSSLDGEAFRRGVRRSTGGV